MRLVGERLSSKITEVGEVVHGCGPAYPDRQGVGWQAGERFLPGRTTGDDQEPAVRNPCAQRVALEVVHSDGRHIVDHQAIQGAHQLWPRWEIAHLHVCQANPAKRRRKLERRDELERCAGPRKHSAQEIPTSQARELDILVEQPVIALHELGPDALAGSWQTDFHLEVLACSTGQDRGHRKDRWSRSIGATIGRCILDDDLDLAVDVVAVVSDVDVDRQPSADLSGAVEAGSNEHLNWSGCCDVGTGRESKQETEQQRHRQAHRNEIPSPPAGVAAWRPVEVGTTHYINRRKSAGRRPAAA